MRCALVIPCLLLSANLAFAQPAGSKLPDGLRHVPLDAMGFVHLRVGDFLTSDIGKQLLSELQNDKEAAKALKKLNKELGIQLSDIETVTVLMMRPPTRQELGPWIGGPRRRPIYKDKWDGPPKMDFEKKAIFEEKDIKPEPKRMDDDKKPEPKASPVLFLQGGLPPRLPEEAQHEHLHLGMQGMGMMNDLDVNEIAEYVFMSGPLFIVRASKEFDRKKLMKAQLMQSSHRDPYSDPYRNGGLLPSEASMLFLNDNTVILGVPWELARHSEQMARNPGPKAKPMESALALAAKPHAIVMGGNVPLELRLIPFMPFGPEGRMLVPMAPLLQTEAAVALNLGKTIELTAQFQAATETSAEQSVQALKSLRTLAELAIEKSNDAAEPGGWKLVLQKRLTQALNTAVIEQKGTLVSAKLSMELDPILVKQYTKEIVKSVRVQGDRTASINNLKHMALAMHAHHDVNKRLPPAGISSINDPQGKPLLSWRVAILPYIDQGPLYQQFDLTQPWDHPTNKKLIARMPHIYVVPGTENKEGETNYRVLVGPTTMFEPGARVNFAQVPDGTSNTIMIVEAAEPTIWTRPDDLPFNPQGPLPKFGTTADGFNVAMGDGTVRFIRAGTPEQTIRALITRNGGEPVSPPD